ncbi:MAG: hypothetical protein C4344_04745, partial [Acidimicrobiia bacterium]
ACRAEPVCERGCADPEGCAFGLAFARLPQRGAWGGSPPRPFWLQHDVTTPRRLARHDCIELGVVFAPKMAEMADVVFDALDVAASRGIAGATFALNSVGSPELHDLTTSAELSRNWGPDVAVRLATPLRLKDRGVLLPVAPPLATLVRALTTRANALASIYAGAPWRTELRELVELAGRADLAVDRTYWLGLLRPRRNRRPDSLSGLVGQVVYSGVPAEVAPWLAFAGVLHVGADTVFGCGRLVAGPAEKPDLDVESLRLAGALAAETIRRLTGSGPVAVSYLGADRIAVHLDAVTPDLRRALNDLAVQLDIRIDVDTA